MLMYHFPCRVSANGVVHHPRGVFLCIALEIESLSFEPKRIRLPMPLVMRDYTYNKGWLKEGVGDTHR